jgi:hypothetical protein
VLDVAEVAGAVQAVQAGDGEFGEVADVVQPAGSGWRASATPQPTRPPGRPRHMPRTRPTAVMTPATSRRVLTAAGQPPGTAPKSPRQAQTGAQ